MYGVVALSNNEAPKTKEFKYTIENQLYMILNALNEFDAVIEDIDYYQRRESHIVDSLVEEIKNQHDIWTDIFISTSEKELFDEMSILIGEKSKPRLYYFSVFLQKEDIGNSQVLFTDWTETLTNYLTTGETKVN